MQWSNYTAGHTGINVKQPTQSSVPACHTRAFNVLLSDGQIVHA